MNDTITGTGPEKRLAPEFGLLDEASRGGRMTVRDDQYEFASLLDAIKACRSHGGRLRLIDTGRFDRYQLEWLLGAGADLYTTDDVERSPEELGSLRKTAGRAGAFVVMFVGGAITDDEGLGPASVENLAALGRSGVDLHLTNRDQARDPKMIARLAAFCRDGKGWLVYYHHGEMDESLVRLAESGARIHVAEPAGEEPESPEVAVEIALAAKNAGYPLIVHVPGDPDEQRILNLRRAGARLVFKSPLFDFRSLLKPLAESRSSLSRDPRLFYLYESFFP